MDDDTYLLPNFDPTSLRHADLRRILLFHDVDFPSSAKKAKLVDLFFHNITPNAETILRQKRNVRPIRPRMEIVPDKNSQVHPQIYLPEVCIEYDVKLRC